MSDDNYLHKLQTEMAAKVRVAYTPDGRPAYGFRIWPGRGDDEVRDTLLNALGNHVLRLGIEVYALLGDDGGRATTGRLEPGRWRASLRPSSKTPGPMAF